MHTPARVCCTIPKQRKNPQAEERLSQRAKVGKNNLLYKNSCHRCTVCLHWILVVFTVLGAIVILPTA